VKTGDAPSTEAQAEAPKKSKTKQIDLVVCSRMSGHLSEERLEEAVQEEASMRAQDKQESERLTAKNSFEEYIYDIRAKLCDELEEFILEDDRNRMTMELEDMENWLYEDGEYAERSIYQNKLGELRTKGEAVKRRKVEWEERPEAMNNLRQCLMLAQKTVDQIKAGDPKYAHLDMSEVNKVEKAISEKTEWADRMTGEVNKFTKTTDPSVLASQFKQEKELFWSMAASILNKPVPKVEPPPQKPDESKTNPADAAAAAADPSSAAAGGNNPSADNAAAAAGGEQQPGAGTAGNPEAAAAAGGPAGAAVHDSMDVD